MADWKELKPFEVTDEYEKYEVDGAVLIFYKKAIPNPIYKQAIDTFGVIPQVDMLIEEMAELTQALLKWRRAKLGAYENLHEEIADVEIMLAQIKTGLNDTLIAKYKVEKLDKLEKLIEKLK